MFADVEDDYAKRHSSGFTPSARAKNSPWARGVQPDVREPTGAFAPIPAKTAPWDRDTEDFYAGEVKRKESAPWQKGGGTFRGTPPSKYAPKQTRDPMQFERTGLTNRRGAAAVEVEITPPWEMEATYRAKPVNPNAPPPNEPSPWVKSDLEAKKYTHRKQDKAPWQKQETFRPKPAMEFAPKSRPAPWMVKGGADPSFSELGGVY